MQRLSLGLVGTSRKPDEHRLAIHPEHLARIKPEFRARILVEHGYGKRFGASDAHLATMLGGLRSREELLEEADIVLLPKPVPEDLTGRPSGSVLWGWPHCVQDEVMTQMAIDRRLTLIAWEAMNHWTSEGSFSLHVFHKNNEVIVNCILQDTDAPLVFVHEDEPARRRSSSRSSTSRPGSATTRSTTARRICGTPRRGRSARH